MAQPTKEVPVNGDAAPFHVDEDLEQRHLNLLQQRLQVHLSESRREEIVQGKHCGAVGPAIVRGLMERYLGKGNLRFSLPGHILVRLKRAAKVLQTQSVERMRPATWIQDEAG